MVWSLVGIGSDCWFDEVGHSGSDWVLDLLLLLGGVLGSGGKCGWGCETGWNGV